MIIPKNLNLWGMQQEKQAVRQQRVVIVLPTYNEKENIQQVLRFIVSQAQYMANTKLSVLVVDDSSPDGTGQLVREFAKSHPNIHLLMGKKQGLGHAYIRGFKYAMRHLQADIVFEMDADLSHDPSLIPYFVREIEKGHDVVIGSRYVEGGSTPQDWPWYRKANSRWGNRFARFVTGMKSVNDCTSGFRAIRTSLLRKIDLRNVNTKGYAFQIALLFYALKKGARVKEFPIQFQDRVHGDSKLKLADILEFIVSSYTLKYPFLEYVFLSIATFIVAMSGFILGLLVQYYVSFFDITKSITLTEIITFGTIFVAIFLTIQSIFNISLMLYAWEDPERIEKDQAPRTYIPPLYSFTALVPVRNEEFVIADTIRAINAIDYPERLKETLVICKTDDIRTIQQVQNTILQINKPNIRLVLFDDLPINKPHSLNIGLKHATKDVVVIFDAEDQPSRSIYHIANTQLHNKKFDVLQSGVQLMNFRSSWYATFNVLEYFFWFKSALHYFAKKGIIPLGGNTVFFKRNVLRKVGGWDEECLTEDAEIGIRLSTAGARIGVVYDEGHSTQEEAPHSLDSFIKQRTRWNQGFMQILLKGNWASLPTLKQRLLAMYILILPQLQAFFFFLVPVSVVFAFVLNLPIVLALLTIVPLILLLLQLIIYTIGMYEFTKGYKKKFPLWVPLKIFLAFYPFQLLLGISASRALLRMLFGRTSWEKTMHLNLHRNKIVKPTLRTTDFNFIVK